MSDKLMNYYYSCRYIYRIENDNTIIFKIILGDRYTYTSECNIIKYRIKVYILNLFFLHEIFYLKQTYFIQCKTSFFYFSS